MKVQGPKIQSMYLIQYLRVFCKLFLLQVFLFIYILQIISKQSVNPFKNYNICFQVYENKYNYEKYTK